MVSLVVRWTGPCTGPSLFNNFRHFCVLWIHFFLNENHISFCDMKLLIKVAFFLCFCYPLCHDTYMCVYRVSALQKYWHSKDKIALLTEKSRHLQIWLKDEYERKLQNDTFYYWVIQHIHVLPNKNNSTFRVHPPIWCEHKYWDSFLTGLSKWSAAVLFHSFFRY